MASRRLDSKIFSSEKRDALIKELKGSGELDYNTTPKAILEQAANLDGSSFVQEDFGTGCLACGEDDDHANILLCEGCNAEYHTYCLSPPLRAVPVGDWFCAQCKIPTYEDDGLDKLVSALPPSFTSRFGEIIWAQGGVGFGWWPAFIYDPRLTVGSARQLSKKHLGKRHLVYFFECHDAPYDCVVDSKMTKWEDGLLEDYHMGKTAKASGRARMRLFQQAMQAATVEMGKPIELRMEFNHTDQPQILPSPKFKQPKRRVLSPDNSQTRQNTNDKPSKRRRIRGFPLLSETVTLDPKQNQISICRNLNRALEALSKADTEEQVDQEDDDLEELCCKLLKRESLSSRASNIGFFKLPSRRKSTFEDARRIITDELVPDCIPQSQQWLFWIPALGPMSRKQEPTLGALYKFLRLSSSDANMGNGTLMSPVKVFVDFVDES